MIFFTLTVLFFFFFKMSSLENILQDLMMISDLEKKFV